MIFALNSRFQK